MTTITLKIDVDDSFATDVLESSTDRLGFDPEGTLTREEKLSEYVANQVMSLYALAKATPFYQNGDAAAAAANTVPIVAHVEP